MIIDSQPASSLPNVGRTLLIGESGTLVREALKVWLETIPAVAQVYGISSSEKCLEMASLVSPALVILPLNFNGESCVQLAIDLKQHDPVLKIAFWFDEVSDLLLCDILASKPVGLLSMRESPSQIAETIKQLLEGTCSYSQSLHEQVQRINKHLAGPRKRKDIIGLTPRQKEVLRFLAQGHSVKEVASKMHLSAKSIDSHKYRIMKKLDIHDRVHLTRFAIREGLLKN